MIKHHEHENKLAGVGFWNNLKEFNFQIHNIENLNENYFTFIGGLKHWINREADKAKQVFMELYLSETQSDIKHYAAIILFNIMLENRDFSGIIDLKAAVFNDINSDDMNFATECSQFPSEKYNFGHIKSALSMVFSITGNPIIEVYINGVKKSFWLDTGAQISVISASTAYECGIKDNLGSTITAYADNTGFQIEARPSYISDLKLGELNIENHPVIIFKDEALQIENPKTKDIININGIIGWNAIQNIDIYIDYKNKTIGINKPAKSITPAANMFAAGRPILKLITIEGGTIHLGIDTGASQSSITERITTKTPVQNVARKLVTIGTAGGSKQIEYKYIEKQEFYMNENKRLIFEKMRVVSDYDEWAVFFKIDGVIGSDFIRNSCLHIDYLNGLVEIDKL